MKQVPSISSRYLMAALAAAFGLGLLSAPAAHAFTLDNQGNTNFDGTAKFSDPDDRLQSRYGSSTSNGTSNGTTLRNGNATLQFGTGAGSGLNGMDDQSFKNNMFSPIGRPMDR